MDGCNIEDFITRVVAIKVFFMNEIYKLKQEIESLKQKIYCGENIFNNNKNNKFENLELQFPLLQKENNFLKTEINEKQKTVDKL